MNDLDGTSSPDGTRIVDWDVARRVIPGGESGLRALCGMMQEECPRMLAALHEALDAGDAHAARIAAHSLLGAARHFGAEPVVAAAARVEGSTVGEDLQAAAAGVPDLEHRVGELIEALGAYIAGGGER